MLSQSLQAVPKVEDLFTRLQGGKSFTKLDLRQAYQQLELEEESKKYVVVNTHKGYTRLLRGGFSTRNVPEGYGKPLGRNQGRDCVY